MGRTKILWVKDEYLQLILTGQKTVEVRVGYENIRQLQPGDTLSLNEQHPYEIVDVRRYPNFTTMVAAENIEAIAPSISDPQVLLEVCHAIYPPEKEALGVIALEIKPVKNQA